MTGMKSKVMYLKWLELKFRHRQDLAIVILLTILLSLFIIVRPNTASADYSGKTGVPSDTLTIKVGYFGGPYYTKKVYKISDLEAMPQVQQAYTFIDRMPAVCIDSARGVRLSDLLADAGIDVNSVETFYFYATDIKNGWYVCLPKSYLLDTKRYYYPKLPEFWDPNSESTIPGAVYGAVRVETIMAIEDNWQRFDTAPDFSNMSGDSRFRLVFGQDDTFTCTASRSARWVHAIEVMLGGTPPTGVILDQDMLNLKVGSTFHLKATVAPFEATDKSVTWSSSDASVATVDNDGIVTVVGQGSATITVSTVIGNMTATCAVNDPNQVAGEQSVMPTGAGSEKNEVQETHGARQYLTEKEFSAASITPELSGSQPWRVFKMSADAVPLQKQKEHSRLDFYTAVIFLSLLLLGAGKRYAEYIREI
jgi:hypothetical protein